MTTMAALERAKAMLGRTPLPVPPMQVKVYEDDDRLTEWHVVDSTNRTYRKSYSPHTAEMHRRFLQARYGATGTSAGTR